METQRDPTSQQMRDKHQIGAQDKTGKKCHKQLLFPFLHLQNHNGIQVIFWFMRNTYSSDSILIWNFKATLILGMSYSELHFSRTN